MKLIKEWLMVAGVLMVTSPLFSQQANDGDFDEEVHTGPSEGIQEPMRSMTRDELTVERLELLESKTPKIREMSLSTQWEDMRGFERYRNVAVPLAQQVGWEQPTQLTDVIHEYQMHIPEISFEWVEEDISWITELLIVHLSETEKEFALGDLMKEVLDYTRKWFPDQVKETELHDCLSDARNSQNRRSLDIFQFVNRDLKKKSERYARYEKSGIVLEYLPTFEDDLSSLSERLIERSVKSIKDASTELVDCSEHLRIEV